MISIKAWRYVFLLIALFAIYLSSFHNYLLFHAVAETISVLIAGAVFFFAWNSRDYLKNNYFLFIGVAYLFIGIIDMSHTFAYKGMGVFTGIDANHPTQLWIAARYLESLSLLLAFQFFRRRLNPYYLFAGFLVITSLTFASIFYWEIFPDCFIEGSGLTVFKKTSEYIISVILLAVIAHFYIYRRQFDKNIHRLLVTSVIVSILAELTFTFYISVFGLSNLIGHLFKIISFYLMYRAIIITGLKQPFSLLLREVKQSEDHLKSSLKEKETLLHEVHHRVKNNMQVISSLLKLQADSIENDQIKEVLKESQNRVYVMSAVHEILHGSDKLSKIDLKTYLSKITTSIFQAYSTDHRNVLLKSDVEDSPISINQAYPLGLIVNELLSNSLKYAFPKERTGEISVSMKRLDKEHELIVMDDGIGMPGELDWKNASSLGLKLVRALSENQLDGSINMKSINGTKFIIKFNIDKT
ncbi:hypothetical protein KKA14_03960 [bacterium]|nr:hypothetical protein [bacterium]